MRAFGAIGPNEVGHVYVLRLKSDNSLYKIGRSGLGKIKDRFTRLKVGSLLDEIFVGTFIGYREWERVAHLRNRDVRLPQSEYFRLSESAAEDTICALRRGSLEESVANSPYSLNMYADESYLVIEDIHDQLAIPYSVTDSFFAAVDSMQKKAELSAEQSFSAIFGND